MRNATIEDVKEAQRTGKLREDVMYSGYGTIFHGKKVEEFFNSDIRRYYGEGCMGTSVIAETHDGVLFVADTFKIEPIVKSPQHANKPKRVKRQPKKGTKPWPAYNPETIKVGDKVRCRDGKIREVSVVRANTLSFSKLDYIPDVYRATGKAFRDGRKWGLDIVGMYEEPAQPKTPQELWIVWFGGECPVAPKKMVQVVHRGGGTSKHGAWWFYWEHDKYNPCPWEVIAYRVLND